MTPQQPSRTVEIPVISLPSTRPTASPRGSPHRAEGNEIGPDGTVWVGGTILRESGTSFLLTPLENLGERAVMKKITTLGSRVCRKGENGPEMVVVGVQRDRKLLCVGFLAGSPLYHLDHGPRRGAWGGRLGAVGPSSWSRLCGEGQSCLIDWSHSAPLRLWFESSTMFPKTARTILMRDFGPNRRRAAPASKRVSTVWSWETLGIARALALGAPIRPGLSDILRP